MTMLCVSNVSLRYGDLVAVRNVSFSLLEGGIAFIAGPNGAGKSTLLRAIAGALKPFTGDIRFREENTARLSVDRIVARGFTLVPEGRDIFATMTVEENLRLGAYLRRDRVEIEDDLAFVFDVFPALKPRRLHLAGLLSGGQQQMLTIARALMTRAGVIAIDEPSLGLAPKVIDQIYDALLELKAKRGLTLLIAEQSFLRAVEVDADLILMRSGEVIRTGKARELARDPSMESSFFGFGEA
jgi:branched-chain amino acid transport system ATP-binding protein